MNYNEKIIKIKNIIKLWKRRYLTPFGKITVIKTLLLPILNHLFISLPNPIENVIKELNTIFYDFLWSGTAKIKQSVVVKQYMEGGLNMINLKAFILALKATWIRRLLRIGGNWTKIIENDININNLANYGYSLIESIIDKTKNKFWQDVLRSHIQVIKHNKITTLEQFLNTPLFQNSSMLVGGTALVYKTWNDRGVYFINDLVTEKGEFYTETDFKKLYNIKTNFLQFNGITQAIKKFAKNSNIIMKNIKSHYPILPSNISIYYKSTKGCKDFYNVLNNNEETPTSKIKWEKSYNISNETWKDIFLSPFKSKYSSTLQWFQTRIIHRILPTKKYLYTIKAIPSPICSYCNQDETIVHLLWTCPATSSFLQKIQGWLRRNNIILPFIEELFIFNIGEQFTMADTSIILEIKYYIFSAKKLASPLSIVALHNKLKCTYRARKYIALKNDTLNSFDKNWNKYKTLLQD